jgi:hypothetical protein
MAKLTKKERGLLSVQKRRAKNKAYYEAKKAQKKRPANTKPIPQPMRRKHVLKRHERGRFFSIMKNSTAPIKTCSECPTKFQKQGRTCSTTCSQTRKHRLKLIREREKYQKNRDPTVKRRERIKPYKTAQGTQTVEETITLPLTPPETYLQRKLRRGICYAEETKL